VRTSRAFYGDRASPLVRPATAWHYGTGSEGSRLGPWTGQKTTWGRPGTCARFKRNPLFSPTTRLSRIEPAGRTMRLPVPGWQETQTARQATSAEGLSSSAKTGMFGEGGDLSTPRPRRPNKRALQRRGYQQNTVQSPSGALGSGKSVGDFLKPTASSPPGPGPGDAADSPLSAGRQPPPTWYRAPRPWTPAGK